MFLIHEQAQKYASKSLVVRHAHTGLYFLTCRWLSQLMIIATLMKIHLESVTHWYLLMSLLNSSSLLHREIGRQVGENTLRDFNPPASSGRREGMTHCITSCTAKQALEEGQLHCHLAYLMHCWQAQNHFGPHQVWGMLGPLSLPQKKNKCCVRCREGN